MAKDDGDFYERRSSFIAESAAESAYLYELDESEIAQAIAEVRDEYRRKEQ